MMTFDIITIFPHILDSYFEESIIKRAQKKHVIRIRVHNLRDWASDRHKTVDDTPYGGGPGMVMRVGPISKAVNALKIGKPEIRSTKSETKKKLKIKNQKSKVILFSVKGKKFDQAMARKFAKFDQLIMISGRYEGVDERVAKYIADMEVSVGDYVLTGGEIPAMIVVDAVTRLIPGVIKEESIEERRFPRPASRPGNRGLVPLESYPAYTRPEVFSPKKGVYLRVPKVLLSGNHKKIKEWRITHAKQELDSGF